MRTGNSKRNSQVNKNNQTEHKQSIKVLVLKIYNKVRKWEYINKISQINNNRGYLKIGQIDNNKRYLQMTQGSKI